MNIIGLKNKIPIFLIIPLILLLTYSIYSGLNKLKEKSTYHNMDQYIHFTTISSDLIHELQKERGYSSGYIASNGQSFKKELKVQRDKTDNKIRNLKKFLKKFNSSVYKFSFNSQIKEFFFLMQQIKKYRTSIDNKTIKSNQIIQFFTQSINTLLGLIENIITITNDSDITILTQSYLTLIKIKEKAGIERALISKVFSQGKLSNNEFYKFGKLVAEQEIYTKYFKNIVPKKYLNIFQKPRFSDINKDISKDRNIIYTKYQKNEILSDIKSCVGYGGLIHNFKNYVIRGKKRYEIGVIKQYKQLLLSIKQYKNIDYITQEEIKQLNTIKNVFLQYKNALEEITKSYKNGDSTHSLDKIIKVDDNPAINALNNLTTHIYGSQTNWFEHATHRINALKDIEDILAKDLNITIDKNNTNLIINIIIQFIILITVMIIIFLLFGMLKKLIESETILKMAQENTRSGSYEYYIKENLLIWSDEHYHLLEVDKKLFTPTLKTFEVFIHPDDRDTVFDGMELAKTSKKISFFNYRVILYDNTVKHVRSSAKVIKYNKKNEPLIMIGTVVDISHFKELEQEIIDTQKDVVFTMGAIGETRSKETGQHVKRVAEYSKLLYHLHGASSHDAELLKMASPMHDIGKVGIPDNILHKPGKLTPTEWAIMQTHAEMGYEMLKNSDREILKLAATVALTHHERYDGNGYPKGLIGNEIPLVGRITAIADVFDALGSDRCYKLAWKLENILELIKNERAKQFDPILVDLFLANLDQFLEIRDMYKDKF